MIAQLVQADEDTVRDVIHRFNETGLFNEIGLACLDPRWAGGRPRLLSPDDEDFVVQTAATRPARLGQPFTRWSIRPLGGHEPSRVPAHGSDLPRVDRVEVGHTYGGARRPSAAHRRTAVPGRLPAAAARRLRVGIDADVAQRGRFPP